ncbi:MAG: glycosyltransferase family 4 protein [Hyphomicrobiales bacterium]
MITGHPADLVNANIANKTEPTSKGRKLLFVITEDWYFCSHRLGLAKAAKDAGYDVAVACRVRNHAKQIEAAGIRLLRLEWNRSNNGVVAQVRDLRALVALYRQERPAICHHVALKPIVLGGLAARLCRIPTVISAVAGLGSVFVMGDVRALMLRRFASFALRIATNRTGWSFVFQNRDDRDRLVAIGAADPDRATIIPGAGVDTAKLQPIEASDVEPIRFAVVSRMLTIKGIEDAVEASKILQTRGVAHRLLLCGAPDPANRACIPESTLQAWDALPTVSWLGHIEDVREIWRMASVAIQPSWGGEGLPKSLLEAAACGRPLIATDVPGCRDIARDQHNAILVPAKSPTALADAMQQLANAPHMRAHHGLMSRALVEQEFSAHMVIKRTLALYGGASRNRHKNVTRA